MTQDLDVLMSWIKSCLVFAALFTTAFPVLYALSRWHRTLLGRLLMFQSVAFALAVDFSLLFVVWQPNILVQFWITAIVFTLIAVSSFLLTVMMWNLNHRRKEAARDERRKSEAPRHDDAPAQ